MRNTILLLIAFVVLNGLMTTISSAQETPTRSSKQIAVFNKLDEIAKRKGYARLIVTLNSNFTPEGNLSQNQKARQRFETKQAQDNLINQLANFDVREVYRYQYSPEIFIVIERKGLSFLKNSNLIKSIQEDEILRPTLTQSIGIVGASNAWNQGFSGAGQTIAILDTGVDKNHAFLNGKVVSEACYGFNDSGIDPETETTYEITSLCPGGVTETTATDSGLHCSINIFGEPLDTCYHGTHVAGIAAGNGDAIPGVNFSGVAKDANIIAIQVFVKVKDPLSCGQTNSTCLQTRTFLVKKGLERVYELNNTYDIAAANMSLGGGERTTNCDANNPYKQPIDNLRSLGIASVVASGNAGRTDALASPACVSTAVSVGATKDFSPIDSVSSFSNTASFLSLLAPGETIESSRPGGTYINFDGTSMAAPHVAGAWAILKQRLPNASVSTLLDVLTNTGEDVLDTRNGINLTKQRIQIDAALDSLTKPVFDFDGDGQTDLSIFRPNTGEWWYINSSNSTSASVAFGSSTDKLVPADYTGDGKTDVAYWRPSNGEWTVLRSEDYSFYSVPFGATNDIPMPGDYDGDGKADLAVFRPSTQTWYILNSNGGTTIEAFGLSGDVPVASDYDGDGKTDIAIFRPSTGEWWLSRSSAGTVVYQFGVSSDKLVQGDYTGDGKSDVALWRPSSGEWFVLRSEDLSFYSFPFGFSTDTPTPADYDGDGKFDVAIFRPSEGNWYLEQSTDGTEIIQFGVSSDVPIPSVFIP